MCREAVQSPIYGESQWSDHTSKQRSFEAQKRYRPSPGTDAAKEKEHVSDLNVQNSNKATAQMLKSGTQQSTPTVPLRATRTKTVKAPIKYGYDKGTEH